MLVTNQSAIGRGMLTEDGLDQIHAELERPARGPRRVARRHLLLPGRAGDDDRTVADCPDRKPGPGMLLRAAPT